MFRALRDAMVAFFPHAIWRMRRGTRRMRRCVATGVPALDRMLGPRALPEGGIVELSGGAAASALALHAVACVQRSGGCAAFIDADQTLEKAYAESVGVNLDRLVVAQPGGAGEALGICERLADSGAVDVIVVDLASELSIRPGDEAPEWTGGPVARAREARRCLRGISAAAEKTGTLCIFTSEPGEKTGVIFGEDGSAPGEMALSSCAVCRILVRCARCEKNGAGEPAGLRVRVKALKNPIGLRQFESELDMPGQYAAGRGKR
ncbi:MAG: DNA recombination/repair protein RecA [Kiritimatiellae bacterium]|nr:DNA recombination/repair protein RecA [Kiritimatiellia bacterium]